MVKFSLIKSELNYTRNVVFPAKVCPSKKLWRGFIVIFAAAAKFVTIFFISFIFSMRCLQRGLKVYLSQNKDLLRINL